MEMRFSVPQDRLKFMGCVSPVEKEVSGAHYPVTKISFQSKSARFLKEQVTTLFNLYHNLHHIMIHHSIILLYYAIQLRPSTGHP